MSTTEAENKKITRQLMEKVWIEGNLAVIDELVADDFVGQNAAAPEPLHGPDEFKEFASEVRTAFPDFDVTVEDVIAEDDKVVARVRLTGTHDGEFLGIEPTGTETEVQSIAISRIEDGQLVEQWSQPDMLGSLQQLGVVELPGE